MIHEIPNDDQLRKLRTSNLQDLLRERRVSHNGLKKKDIIKKLIAVRESEEMANPKSTLWLRLEGQPSPTKLKFRNSDMDSEDPDLANLAELLCKKNNHLKTLNVVPAYLQFLGDYDGADNDERNPDGTLRLDIFVRALRTSAKSPLVVRHPLSDDRIVVNLKLVKSSREITLSHTTGTWHMLLDEATSVYPILLSDRSNIYFVDPGDKKKTIAKEFDFNKLLEKTANDEGSRVVNFIVRIKGLLILNFANKLQHCHEAHH
ncbi:hypothetical protein BC936DRAFT_145171 [Jimgerdemannia flammicorona]|uniref:Uncharacterized protein n=1 Tax=Jimgerdemannia flammicorona TaxID=994334 RepID=A0A433DAQ6_9FUNG|nr:hypothetical protein BC936DRAFT_145171 [Jimgerdemannia flammicorona]